MSFSKNIRTGIFIFLTSLKNRPGVLLMLGILVLLTGPGQAFAASLTVDRTRISRGDPLVFTYDLSDLAGSYDHAELRLEAWAGRHFFEYEHIPLQNVQGTCTFTDTDRGNWLFSYIVLLDANGMYISQIDPGVRISYSGNPWQFTNPVQHNMINYSAVSANAGDTITVEYGFTGGTGNYKEIYLGWMVFDNAGNTLASSYSITDKTSDTLTFVPTIEGRHAFGYHVTDSDGWHYQFEDTGGIQVTGDLTGNPLSAVLTWKDENGNTLDWTKDQAAVNQQIFLSWEIQGGFSAYDGRFEMRPTSGEATFSEMESGSTGTFDFRIRKKEDLTLEITVSDNHGNSQTQQVTIPVAGPVMTLENSLQEQDYYLFPGMKLDADGEGVCSRSRLADIEGMNMDNIQVSWDLEQVWGTATAELAVWEATATLMLTKLPETAEDSIWIIRCTPDGGQTLQTVCTVHFRNAPAGMSLPAGWDQISMLQNGKWAADINETILLDNVFCFTNAWCIPGLPVTAEVREASDNFWSARNDFGPNGFSMNASDVYAVEIVLRCCNIKCEFWTLLYIRDSSGNLPVLIPQISMNAYGMDTNTGETWFYFDSGLTIADPAIDRAFSLPGVLTCTVENMEFFPDGMTWDMTRISGNADAVLNTRNNGMNGDLDMRTMPASEGNSVFEIRCLYHNTVVWTRQCTVHVVRLNQQLPTGNLRTGGKTRLDEWYAEVGRNIPMSDIFDFQNGWRIQGKSHLLVSMYSDDDSFWENLGCGEGLHWGMDLRQKGIYPVIVITSCYNVSWGHEYMLYVGKTPRITGDTIQLPLGLKVIEAESFMNTDAQIVVIPDDCDSIGAQAFADSPRLTEVEIPESVTKLDATAFDNCPNLRLFVTQSQAAKSYAESHGILAVTE